MVGKDTVDQLFDVIEREDTRVADADAPEDGQGPGRPERPSTESEVVDIVLRVHVQPGAGRTAVVGRHGDALKVKVAAPPEGGRANEAVVEILATTLGVATSAVTLVTGATSRSKRFRIGPVDLDVVRRLISSAESSGNVGGAARSGNVRGRSGVR